MTVRVALDLIWSRSSMHMLLQISICQLIYVAPSSSYDALIGLVRDLSNLTRFIINLNGKFERRYSLLDEPQISTGEWRY